MRHGAAGDRELPPDLERFAFEGSKVFELAMEVAEMTDELAVRHRRTRPWLASQIGRAGLSVLNNVAEGYGESSPGDKSRLYRYALRSASETAAMIVFLARKALLTLAEEIRARRLLLTAMKTLGRMARHFSRKSGRSGG